MSPLDDRRARGAAKESLVVGIGIPSSATQCHKLSRRKPVRTEHNKAWLAKKIHHIRIIATAQAQSDRSSPSEVIALDEFFVPTVRRWTGQTRCPSSQNFTESRFKERCFAITGHGRVPACICG